MRRILHGKQVKSQAGGRRQEAGGRRQEAGTMIVISG